VIRLLLTLNRVLTALVALHHCPRFQPAIASWYFDAGPTASGAHARYGIANRILPFGTRVQIRYQGAGLTGVVDDRGPWVAGRSFDLNQTTAARLRFSGVAMIAYRVLPARGCWS
jgi:rare lipoprotein A (peptidoglycan hydrolase)